MQNYPVDRVKALQQTTEFITSILICGGVQWHSVRLGIKELLVPDTPGATAVSLAKTLNPLLSTGSS